MVAHELHRMSMDMNDITKRPLSYSRISTFLGCRKAYHYGYVEELTRRYEIPRITRGSLVDSGITEAIRAQEEGHDMADCQVIACDEIARAGREWMRQDFIASLLEENTTMREECCDLIAEAQIIARRAVKSYDIGAGRWRTFRINGELALQYDLTCEMESWPGGFIGKLDWLAEDKVDGSIWLIDFKVRDNIRGDEELQWDYQLPTYQYVVQKRLGIRVTYTAQAQIRAKVPAEPKLLKSGALSKDVRGTDFDTYLAAIVAEDLKPDDFKPQLMKLRANPFDHMTTHVRSTDELEAIWQEAEMVASHIYGAHVLQGVNPGSGSVRRLHVMQCRGCRFQELCMAELKGYDATHIRNEMYAKKVRRA